MKRLLWVCLFFGLILSWSLVYAGDFYVVPVKKCCICKGTLVGTRWCDNEDGTVTDMTTCLVWLKKADWGGTKPWRNDSTDCSDPSYTCYDDAHTRAGLLAAGSDGADLSDASSVGDWRLPTAIELEKLASDPEAVRSGNMRAFTGVQESYYWSSTTTPTPANDTSLAWFVYMGLGFVNDGSKTRSHYVWPVRSGN